MADTESLTRKRTVIKTKLTKFKNYVDSLVDVELTKLDKIQLETRISKIDPLINEFEEIQIQIDDITKDDEAGIIEIDTFEASFYPTLAKAKLLLTNNNVSNSNNVSSVIPQNSSSIINNAIQLPTIQLPKFHGEYNSWLEFRDTFESLINSNNSITDIQKFHYLRASLDGEAAGVIKSLEFSAPNYNIAWNVLSDRYNNTSLLIQNHMKALFSLEHISKESSIKIHKLIDDVSKHLRALETLKEPVKHWDTLIIYLMVSRLDPKTARDWEMKKASLKHIKLTDLKDFLKHKAGLLECLDADKSSKSTITSKSFPTTTPYKGQSSSCEFCSQSHFIHSCEAFLKLSSNDKYSWLKSHNICINCLRKGHNIKMCKSSNCRKCNGRHNTLLHHEQKRIEQPQQTPVERVTMSSNITNAQILLSTALVYILDNNKKRHTVRALLDSGSQSSFITNNLCERLNLPTKAAEITLMGICEVQGNISKRCETTISSKTSKYSTCLEFFIINQISSPLPNFSFDSRKLEIPDNIKLADPNFNKKQNIDILIGADIFWDILCIGNIKLGRNLPTLQKTRFGWIISGPFANLNGSNNQIACNFITRDMQHLDEKLEKFWQIEECPSKRLLSEEEMYCEQHFQETTIRDENGRFVVNIPLKGDPSTLGDSKEIATRRFYSLERKLLNNPMLKQQYIKFMDEYISLGHMSEYTEADTINQKVYYMPHHGVLKENSISTKLRVVFDGSAATSNGTSINNIQCVGPTIQQDLLSIILRFRTHAIVITADVQKMYRQILVTPSQRSLQCNLWRSESSEQLKTYSLNTVTYGTSAASFLAIRTLIEIGNICPHPEIAQIIKNDFYVDDLLTGAESVEAAKNICIKTTNALKQGCFELKKFASNSPEILHDVKEHISDLDILDFATKENAKTLGLIWSCQQDTLLYRVDDNLQSKEITKRTILSTAAQIFDPLGLLAPCTILIKIIMQQLWLQKLNWDESLPAAFHTKWIRLRDSLSALNCLQLPRIALCSQPINIQLHGFSDSSEHAYGGCIYLRSIDAFNNITVRLLCAKTKVAPLKTITLPRLELCGAHLLAKLAQVILQSLNIPIDSCTYWSDSTITLCWIRTQPNLLKTFVNNRVAKIQNITHSENWRYVPTSLNPADYLTRGIQPIEIQQAENWWSGPDFLHHNSDKWPIEPTCSEIIPEMRTALISTITCAIPFENYSTLNKLQRVIAQCLRFTVKCRKQQTSIGPLTLAELDNSLLRLVKIVQKQCYNSELNSLILGKEINTKSNILSLSPFLDANSIIRVGGRLLNSTFSYDKRHPILMDNKHILTKLIFESEHRRLLHAGPQLLLSSVRERFWVPSGLNLAKNIVRNCVRCFRAKPFSTNPIMGHLPESRIHPEKPFTVVGVDYGGPFIIKDRKGRGAKTSKCYLALFVCFVTKAVHLEIVSDLTTESFILSLRRFASRRGKPTKIYSDNGTNFVGANSELKGLDTFLSQSEHELTKACTQEGISWQFIPAHSPHMGGLWEAGIKSSKHHLKRVMGDANLTFEELYTLFSQIEAILNSRPLTSLSSDPNDLSALTPAHFLIGQPLTSIPNPDLTHLPTNRLNMYQRVQQIQQHFWKRWSVEYIAELQSRKKWRKNSTNININDIVLLKEDHLPPMCWRLGRIIELHSGPDGVVRVVTIRTSKGVLRRAVTKICILPIEKQ